MSTLLRRFVRQSVMKKGVSGKSPFWTLVGTLSVLNSLRKRFAGRTSVPVVSGPIRPGEVIEIRHSGAPDRSLRKERGKRAELVQTYAAAPSGRKGRKIRKKFAGTLVEEFASASGLAQPALAQLIDSRPKPKPLSRRVRRQQAKRLRKAASKNARTAAKAHARSQRGARSKVDV
jgi:hypothetical protein